MGIFLSFRKMCCFPVDQKPPPPTPPPPHTPTVKAPTGKEQANQSDTAPRLCPSILPFPSYRRDPARLTFFIPSRRHDRHFQSALIASVQPPKSHSSPCRPHRVTVPDCFFLALSFFGRELDADRDAGRDGLLFWELEEQKE